jgi:hypothetical protein
MNLRFLPLFLVLLFAISSQGQQQPQSELDSLLKATSHVLDRYQGLAAAIHCGDAPEKTLRDACKVSLETLEGNVRDTKDKLAGYRHLPDPQPVDLFDIYQAFQRTMQGIGEMEFAADLYDEPNRIAFAGLYNNFIKVYGWFGNVVRDAIEHPENTLPCQH